MSCKGICYRYKATKIMGESWYKSNKRCQRCELFIGGRDKSNCPCCGSKLRTGPRNKKYKEKLRVEIG